MSAFLSRYGDPAPAPRVLGNDVRGRDRRCSAHVFRAASSDQGDRSDAVGLAGDGAQGHPEPESPRITQTYIALPMLPTALAVHSGRHPPGYSKLYIAAVDGDIPAEKIGARWYIRRDRLREVATILGLTSLAAIPTQPIA